MADRTYWEWLQGDPESQARDAAIQRREYEAVKASPMYRTLRRMGDDPIYDPQRGTTYDPRELRMNMAIDAFYPRMGTPAWDAEKAAADYVLNMGQRVRDTGLKAVHALGEGDLMRAGELAARSPASAFYPPASAGTSGSEDDWRVDARKNGVPEGYIAAFDFGTDPEMWLTAPVTGPAKFVVPAVPFAMAKGARAVGGRADDLIRTLGRAADQAMHGPGALTQLIDDSGNVIQRLPNSPPAPRLRLEWQR